ncbi:hypothetical protein FQA39_LY08912 [Lamprigera yunnana]|nr:hypothetical protein FQA39_LY08912 [Lamprigera yunnana]
MSLLDQSRSLAHVQGLTPNSNQLMVPHPLEGPPNPDVLLALLARNKALEVQLFGRPFCPYTTKAAEDYSKLILRVTFIASQEPGRFNALSSGFSHKHRLQ